MKQCAPPSSDQIEITLIGPGYGESILIHLGNNKWIVVDSCLDASTMRPAPLAYLESLGLKSNEVVQLIVASHWHDDHIRGLGEVLKECPNANFCCSSALSKNEFVAMVYRYVDGNEVAGGAGPKEMHSIFETLASRPQIAKKAQQNRKILNVDSSGSGHGEECNIWTLSPSDKQIDLFLDGIAKLLPSAKQTKSRAATQSPNQNAVVLWIQIGDVNIMLGSDLEESDDSDGGWTVIVNSPEKPNGKASVFKIPHHGSPNGHCDEVWKSMINNDPITILTPFNKGKRKLPDQDDIVRINGVSKESYSSAKIKKTKSKKKRPSAVEKTIKEITGNLTEYETKTGIVRLRNNGKEDPDRWDIELFNGACKLCDVYA